MKVLVDTSVWSLALRRSRDGGNAGVRGELASLIDDGRAAIIGPIRQEILSGIKERDQYQRLRDHLRWFPDTAISTDDYEEAATFYNRCRTRGIQGSNTDFLICAVAARYDYPIFTTDADFARFAKVLPIVLHG